MNPSTDEPDESAESPPPVSRAAIMTTLFQQDDVTELLALARQSGRSEHIMGLNALLAFGLACWGFCTVIFSDALVSPWAVGAVAVGLLYLGGQYVPDIFQQTNATQMLAQYNDVEGVGPLTAGLTLRDRAIRTACEKALTRLLPRLRASDRALLNTPQRDRLHQALFGKNSELSLAILRALEQVGDHHALPYVRTLADGDHKAARRDWRIQDAAIACLPFLEMQNQQSRLQSTLLRPSERPPLNEDDLLHPALGVVELPPAELVRSFPPQKEC